MEDCLEEAEMTMVWSSDPDTTYFFERDAASRMGEGARIKMVNIDPHLSPPRPGLPASGSHWNRCGPGPGDLWGQVSHTSARLERECRPL